MMQQNILKGFWGGPQQAWRGYSKPSQSELSKICEGRCAHVCLQRMGGNLATPGSQSFMRGMPF